MFDFLGKGYLDGVLCGQGTWLAWIQTQINLFGAKYIPCPKPKN